MQKSVFFLVFIVLNFVSCRVGQQDEVRYMEVSSPGFEKTDSLLNTFVSGNIIPGAVALVAREGNVIYHHAAGFANIRENRSQEVGDIFRIASMTKQITSVAAMILFDQGLFGLDDPVGKYLPGFAEMQIVDAFDMSDSTFTGHPAENRITIRHLFTHSSGIGYGFQDEELMALLNKAGITEGFEQRDILLEENIKRLSGIPLMHEPGLRFTYGLNMDVLGRLIEIWSGQPLDRFFQEHIFDPLGMKDTHFYLPREKYPRLVDVYKSTPGGVVLSPDPYYDYPVRGAKTYLSGGADLSSTAYDYYLFCQMMLNGGTLNGVRILEHETAALMTGTHLETGDYDMGLGFSVLSEKTTVTDARSAGSYSGGGYFGTSYWVDPAEDLVAILMLQVYPFESHGIYRKFEDLVYEAIGQVQ